MRVLGIETSCDETGIAIYDDEKGLLANQLYSQVKLHADYGGVVPELASRDHVRKTVPLIQEALKESGLTAKTLMLWPIPQARISRRTAGWRDRGAFSGVCLGRSGNPGTSYGRTSVSADAGR